MKLSHLFNAIILGFSCFIDIAFSEEFSVTGDVYPPYQYDAEENRVSGFSYEVLNAVLAVNGDRISSSTLYPWKRALLMIKTGSADILISANYNDTRRSYVRYPSEPIVVSPWYFWKRSEENIKFRTLDDLKELRVGVVQGYTYTNEFWALARKYGIHNDAGNYNDETNLRNLSRGKYDLALAEYGNGLHIKQKLNLKNISPLTYIPLKEDGLYAIFNRTKFSQEYVNNFSTNLLKFKSTDQYRDSYRRYFK